MLSSALKDQSGIPELYRHFRGIAERRNLNHLNDCVVEANHLVSSIIPQYDDYVAMSDEDREVMRTKWASHSAIHPNLLQSRLDEVRVPSLNRGIAFTAFKLTGIEEGD
jgi:hypothetical protein